METPDEKSQFVIRITAEQFKNVKIIDFVPNRYVTQISGKNGAGKTSVLDVIFYGLMGRKTLSPALIRQGQKKGYIRIETNTAVITRHLNDKGGDLKVEMKGSNTLQAKPDDWLKNIAGNLGLDPLKFKHMDPEQQFQALKTLVPEIDVDDLETRNTADAESVTRKRAEAKRLEAARDHITVDKTLPAEAVNIENLLREAREATERNEALERERNRRQQIVDAYARQQASMADKARQIENLKSELQTLTAEAKQTSVTINEWEPLEPLRDRAALDAKVSEATRTNAAIASNSTNRTLRERFEGDVDVLVTEIKKLEEEMRSRKLTIAAKLEKAKFPIAGLSFETITEGSSGRERKNPKKIITYNGVPLADASSAEQIRVSTAIGMANNPELRFLLIREGSLLDDKGLAIIEEMAHEHGFQILMEIVSDTGKVGIFMEDGTITAVNAEPEEEAPAAAAPKKSTAPKKSKGKKAE